MVARDESFCSSCPQKRDCKQVYERLGHSDAPPVLLKVTVSMVLPLLAFVSVMAASDHAVRRLPVPEGLGAFAALLAGAIAGLLVMLAGRGLARRFGKEQGKV